MKSLLTVREVAQQAGVSVKTVYAWIERGAVHAHDFSKSGDRYRKLRIRADECQRIMANIEQGAPIEVGLEQPIGACSCWAATF